MQALTRVARSISYSCAHAIDMARVSEGDEKTHWQERANLLTPVAKAFSTDIGSRGGLARHPGAWRHGLHRGDGRGGAAIATRASPRSTKAPTASRRSTSSPANCRSRNGEHVLGYIAELAEVADAVAASNRDGFGRTAPDAGAGTGRSVGGHPASPEACSADGRDGRGAGRRYALSQAVRARRRRRLSGAGRTGGRDRAGASRSAVSSPRTWPARRPRCREQGHRRRRRAWLAAGKGLISAAGLEERDLT